MFSKKDRFAWSFAMVNRDRELVLLTRASTVLAARLFEMFAAARGNVWAVKKGDQACPGSGKKDNCAKIFSQFDPFSRFSRARPFSRFAVLAQRSGSRTVYVD